MSIFAPVYVTVIASLGLIGYILYVVGWSRLSAETPKINLYFLVTTILMISSLVAENYIGFYVSIGILGAIIIISFYRLVYSRVLFDLIVKIITALSLLVAILGVVQFASIYQMTDPKIILMLDNSPEERVVATFFNANYYATIIEFVIIVVLYKLIKLRRREDKFYYGVVLIVNMVMLYLTGTRSAWIAIVVALPFLFVTEKKYKTGIFLGLGELLGVIALLVMNWFPRLGTMDKDFSYRMRIWDCSLNIFEQHPFFGIGPLGYKNVVRKEMLDAPWAAHSHSIYVESLLAMGIVNYILFGIIVFNYFRDLIMMRNQGTFAMIITILIATLVHGFVDETIFNVQTGMLFLILVNSFPQPQPGRKIFS